MARDRSAEVRQTKEERMRLELPYGVWSAPDGRSVLFNRWYQPIWERHGPAPAKAADAHESMSSRDWQWFYADDTLPWRDRRSAIRCEAVLAEWGVPLPDMDAPRMKPRGSLGLYRGPLRAAPAPSNILPFDRHPG